MNTPKIENLLALTIGKSALKESFGEGYEFDLIYEALLKDVENEESIVNSFNSNNDKNDESYKIIQNIYTGQKIEDIPLKIRQVVDSNEININNNYTKNVNLINENYILSNLLKEDNLSIEEEFNKINEVVDKYSEIYNVDKSLILAIIKQESNFNKNAISSAGAKGLMQIMDFNLESYGVSNPYDIEENIEAGVKHIKYCLNRFDGNVEMALMAYNAGEGTMERRGVTSTNDLYKMPEETQNYVSKIMSNIINT